MDGGSPAPARLSPASPGSHAGRHRVNTGRGNRDGAGTRERVTPVQSPGCLSEGTPVGDTLLLTPRCASLGWGLCPGGCPGRAGSGEGRQPPRAGTSPARHGRGQGDVGRGTRAASQTALPASQERFLPPGRKVCAGSGNTESFPARGELSWQQRDLPVSRGGLGEHPKSMVGSRSFLGIQHHRRWPSPAPPHWGGLCGSFTRPWPQARHPREQAGGVAS